MDTEAKTDAGAGPTEAAWKPYRLSVGQFLAMIDAGIFPHDARVEWLGGVLIRRMVKGDPHDNTPRSGSMPRSRSSSTARKSAGSSIETSCPESSRAHR